MKFNNEELQLQIERVMELRNKRYETYGDGWTGDPIEYDLWMMFGKVKRAIHLNKKGDDSDYEKMSDTLIDLINYALFALAKNDKAAG